MIHSQSFIPLILSLLAGLSTIIGAFILFFSKKQNKKLLTFALSFSAGVMITVSFTDLFASAEETLRKYHGNLQGVFLSLFFLIALLIDKFIPDKPKTYYNSPPDKLYRVGFVSMIALMIHNFPEGIATFVSGYESTSLGISIAIAIALHNIPKAKAFKYTLYSGLAEPIGAIIAFLFLRPYINEIILAITFALVAGIMLYISFSELIPAAREYKYHRTYLCSIFLGILTIILSHIYAH